MKKHLLLPAVLSFLVFSTLLACGVGLKTTPFSCSGDALSPKDAGSENKGYSAGAGTLTTSPIAIASISVITPLGNLNPASGHYFPTDHIYLQLVTSTAGSTTVVAAANATVYSVAQHDTGDYKVIFQMDKSFYYYYDHITPSAGITEGASVTAGQTVGTNSGDAAAVDLGIVNYNVNRSFIDKCLFNTSIHADAPIPYFTAAVSAQLYALVPASASSNKDGSIDYDIKDKLMGPWIFEEATGDSAIGSSDDLAFGHDPYFPASPRVSIGGRLSPSGLYGVQSGAPDFSTVSTGSGVVNYTLYSAVPSSAPSATASGQLIVQMVTGGRIKVEAFSSTSGTPSFDGGALYYQR